MGNKVKIHEIAKKIGKTSKEVLEKANLLGIEATSHLSGVENEEAKRIEDSFKNNTEKKADEMAKKQSEPKTKKEVKEEPVIIRRQVIMQENEDKNKN